MAEHAVTVLVDEREFFGWSSLTWKSSLSAIVDELKVQMPAIAGSGLVGGELVEVLVDGKRLFSGWIDSVNVAISSVGATAEVQCRSLTADVVDSAVDLRQRPAELFDVTLIDVLREYVLSSTSIRVRTTVAGLPTIPKVAVQPGETIFDLIERYARQAGVLLRTAGDGSLEIEKAGATVSSERLVLGENLAECQIKVDLAQRYYITRVIGQSPTDEGFGGEEATGASGEAVDEAIRSSRLTVIQAAGPVSPSDCRDQAAWQAAVSAAKSSVVSGSVVGWTDGEALWRPNTLVDVDLGTYGFEARLLVDSVSLSLTSQGGYSGSLDLISPGAYAPQPVRAVASDEVRERLRATGEGS